MIQRPCLKCGALIAGGSYCGRCQPSYSPTRLRGRRWMRRRLAVLREAQFICERCGERVAEEVHHLNGVEDNRMQSLMAVCFPCHRQLEIEKRAGLGVR